MDDDIRREYVSSDGLHWYYTIEHQQQEDGIAWRARVWEQKDVYRGVLEGRVTTAEPGDPDVLCNVAIKMALDATYLRDFTEHADEAPAALADDPGAVDGLLGTDPLPAPV